MTYQEKYEQWVNQEVAADAEIIPTQAVTVTNANRIEMIFFMIVFSSYYCFVKGL